MDFVHKVCTCAIHLPNSARRPVVGSCEHDNENSIVIKYGKCNDNIHVSWVIKTDRALVSRLFTIRYLKLYYAKVHLTSRLLLTLCYPVSLNLKLFTQVLFTQSFVTSHTFYWSYVTRSFIKLHIFYLSNRVYIFTNLFQEFHCFLFTYISFVIGHQRPSTLKRDVNEIITGYIQYIRYIFSLFTLSTRLRSTLCLNLYTLIRLIKKD
jgi:hypothetical protein